MSVSIQELDNTVRAFYEGKGDLVSDSKGNKRLFRHANLSASPLAKASPTDVNRGRSKAVTTIDIDILTRWL